LWSVEQSIFTLKSIKYDVFTKEFVMTICKKATIALLSIMLSFSTFALNLEQAMDSLSQAKVQGLVGEQADGYLGVVKNEGNASEIAQLINQARKTQYQKVSNESHVPLNEVEKKAGSKAQEKTPAGQYIKRQGQWLIK
jgi:uncharacterized protein